MKVIFAMLCAGMLLIGRPAPLLACMARSIESNEIQIMLARVTSKVDLARVKAALGPGYFNQIGKSVVFRCVDGNQGDIVLTEAEISFKFGEGLTPAFMAQMVEKHLFWLKMIGALDIDLNNIRLIAARITAEKRAGGYFLAYAHEDPFYESGNCVEKILGRTSSCEDSCIKATLYPGKCDRACNDRIRQARIDCFLTCDPSVRSCYEAATKDEWKVLGGSSVVQEDGVTYRVKCMGGSGLREGIKIPEKALNVNGELENFMSQQE